MKLLKIVLYAVSGVVVLLLLLSLTIRLPMVQEKLKDLTTKTLEEQLKQEVSIESFRLRFPKSLVVNHLLISNPEKDTLLYLEELSINVRLWPLLKKKLVVGHVQLAHGRGAFDQVLTHVLSDEPGGKADPDKESGDSAWSVELEKLSIQSFHGSYQDESDVGFELILDIGDLTILFGTLNLESNLSFQSLRTEETTIRYEILDIGLPEDPDTSSLDLPGILLEEVLLSNTGFSLVDSAGALLLDVSAELFQLSELSLNLNSEAISLDAGRIVRGITNIQMLESTDTSESSGEALDWGQSLWRISGNSLELDYLDLGMNSIGVSNTPGVFNPDRLNVQSIQGHLQDFTIQTDTLVAVIDGLSGYEANGFQINTLDAELGLDDRGFYIRDFEMHTSNGRYRIGLHSSLSPTNYENFQEHHLNLLLDIQCQNLGDVEYIFPLEKNLDFLTPEFSGQPFSVQLEVEGKPDAMHVRQADLLFMDSTAVSLSGTIENLMNELQVVAALDLDRVWTSGNNLRTAFRFPVSDSVVGFPVFMQLSGELGLEGDHLDFQGRMVSDVGEIFFEPSELFLSEPFRLKAELTADLHMLERIYSAGVGEVAFRAGVDATIGDLMDDSQGLAFVEINRIVYLESEYRAIQLSAEMENGIFSGSLNAQDSSMSSEIAIQGTFNPDSYEIRVQSDLDSLDLYRLDLVETPLKISSQAELIYGAGPEDALRIGTTLNSLNLYFPDTSYRIHPIRFSLDTDRNQTALHLKSAFYYLDFTAQDSLEGLLLPVDDLIQDLLLASTPDPLNIPDFKLDGGLVYPEAFARIFFPGLPAFDSLSIRSSYQRSTDQFNFSATIPKLYYESLEADSLRVDLNRNASGLRADVHVQLAAGELVEGDLLLSAFSADSAVVSNITYKDASQQDFLNLTAGLSRGDTGLFMRILQDSLTLKYEPWQVDPENRIEWMGSRVGFERMELTHKEETIRLFSGGEANPKMLGLDAQMLDLSRLDELLSLDTLVRGSLGLKVMLNPGHTDSVFFGSLNLEHLRMQGIEIGEVTGSALLDIDSRLDAGLLIQGPYQDVSVSLTTELDDEELPLQGSVDIKKFDLVQLNSPLDEYIYEAKGLVQGTLELTGSAQDPDVSGSIRFEDAAFGVVASREYYRLGTESIRFLDNTIQFDKLTIRNNKDQQATVEGSFAFGRGQDFYSDLVLSTDNMELLNSGPEDSDLIFGLLKAQSDIRIKGPMGKRDLDIGVKIDRDTRVTYIFPDELTIHDNKGVVQYHRFNPDSLELPQIREEYGIMDILSFRSLRSNITIESGAGFSLFFDSSGNDHLDATLRGQVNYSELEGSEEISGMFVLEEGTLNYGIPMVSVDKFTLEPGSYITLTNDLYNPYLDLTASSEVRASTEGLMDDYNKVMKFKVLLKMKGELNGLSLSFDIDTQTPDALVSAKLGNLTAQERNINALNLLARGSFVFSLQGTEAGGTSMMDAQIDKFYTDQLNNLISDNIHFVDVSFDVQSFNDYNTSGEKVFRRNYYYNVGKSFLNNRARINYKGSMDFATEQDAQTVLSNFVENELEVELYITKDGTYRAVFFRKNQYEGLLEGEVVETGAGIRFNKNFHSVKNIFWNEKKKNQDKKEVELK